MTFEYQMITEFEWDRENLDKNYKKHGITPNETEEIFLDDHLLVLEDFKHAQKEDRFIALGKTLQNKVLFVVFTIRKNKIRVISGRVSSRKERKLYEKKAEKNSIF